MATVIRLKRGGRRNAPYYRIVVMDRRTRVRGREIDQVGVYQPCAKPEPVVELDRRKVLEWLQNGARYSDTVRDVLRKNGVLRAYASGMAPEDMVVEQAPAVDVPGEVEDSESSAAVAESEETKLDQTEDTETADDEAQEPDSAVEDQ